MEPAALLTALTARYPRKKVQVELTAGLWTVIVGDCGFHNLALRTEGLTFAAAVDAMDPYLHLSYPPVDRSKLTPDQELDLDIANYNLRNHGQSLPIR